MSNHKIHFNTCFIYLLLVMVYSGNTNAMPTVQQFCHGGQMTHIHQVLKLAQQMAKVLHEMHMGGFCLDVFGVDDVMLGDHQVSLTGTCNMCDCYII